MTRQADGTAGSNPFRSAIEADDAENSGGKSAL
jgi:hypothetical protein